MVRNRGRIRLAFVLVGGIALFIGQDGFAGRFGAVPRSSFKKPLFKPKPRPKFSLRSVSSRAQQAKKVAAQRLAAQEKIAAQKAQQAHALELEKAQAQKLAQQRQQQEQARQQQARQQQQHLREQQAQQQQGQLKARKEAQVVAERARAAQQKVQQAKQEHLAQAERLQKQHQFEHQHVQDKLRIKHEQAAQRLNQRQQAAKDRLEQSHQAAAKKWQKAGNKLVIRHDSKLQKLVEEHKAQLAKAEHAQHAEQLKIQHEKQIQEAKRLHQQNLAKHEAEARAQQLKQQQERQQLEARQQQRAQQLEAKQARAKQAHAEELQAKHMQEQRHQQQEHERLVAEQERNLIRREEQVKAKEMAEHRMLEGFSHLKSPGGEGRSNRSNQNSKRDDQERGTGNRRSGSQARTQQPQRRPEPVTAFADTLPKKGPIVTPKTTIAGHSEVQPVKPQVPKSSSLKRPAPIQPHSNFSELSGGSPRRAELGRDGRQPPRSGGRSIAERGPSSKRRRPASGATYQNSETNISRSGHSPTTTPKTEVARKPPAHPATGKGEGGNSGGNGPNGPSAPSLNDSAYISKNDLRSRTGNPSRGSGPAAEGNGIGGALGAEERSGVESLNAAMDKRGNTTQRDHRLSEKDQREVDDVTALAQKELNNPGASSGGPDINSLMMYMPRGAANEAKVIKEEEKVNPMAGSKHEELGAEKKDPSNSTNTSAHLNNGKRPPPQEQGSE